MATNWTYLLADLRTNNILAQVPLVNVQNPTLRLNTAGTLSGSIPVRSVPGDPYRYTTPARTAIYALRDGQPWWGGIIWTRRYQAATGTVDIQAADWWSYFDHRFTLGYTGDFTPANALVGSPDPGTTAHGTLAYGYSGTLTGQTDIVKALLATTLGNSSGTFRGGDIRLQVYAPSTAGTLRQVMYPNFELISYSKAFADLANLTDGPDLMFGVNGWDTTGAPQRCLWVGDPELVFAPGNVVFTYGANLLDYTWASDGTNIASRTWALGQNDNVSTMMSRVDSPDMIDSYGWPLLESKETYDDITQGTQYQQLQVRAASDAHGNRHTVVVPSLTVRTDMPPHLRFGPGDLARLIIQDDYFRDGLDIIVKITDVAVSVTGDTAQLSINPVDQDIP
jgi:hypothetical protein